MVLACSALKQDYRLQLRQDMHEVIFVYLKGDYDLIFNRMQVRKNHYMTEGMLQSQFDDLEEPAEAITIDIDQELKSIVDQVIQNLDLDKDGSEYGSES